MRKAIVGSLLAAGLLGGVCLSADEPRTVLVISRINGPYKEFLEGFKGKAFENVRVINMDSASFKSESLRALNPAGTRIVVAAGEKAVRASEAVPAEIPVFRTMVMDADLAAKEPVLGMSIELDVAEQLKKLAYIFPSRRRLMVIFDPAVSSKAFAEARSFGEAGGWTVLESHVSGPADLSTALAKETLEKADVLWIFPDRAVVEHSVLAVIIRRSKDQKIPLVGISPLHGKMGATVVLTVDFKDIGVQTAEAVEKLLNGKGGQGLIRPRRIISYINTAVALEMGVKFNFDSDDILTIK